MIIRLIFSNSYMQVNTQPHYRSSKLKWYPFKENICLFPFKVLQVKILLDCMGTPSIKKKGMKATTWNFKTSIFFFRMDFSKTCNQVLVEITFDRKTILKIGNKKNNCSLKWYASLSLQLFYTVDWTGNRGEVVEVRQCTRGEFC